MHPARLPLAAGWNGYCCAPNHQGSHPAPEEIRALCNLGYASGCSRLPQHRVADAVRFSVIRDRRDQLTVCFVCELAHRPVAHGTLNYDLTCEKWLTSHPEPCIQRMADCYLQSYLLRRAPFSAVGPAPGANS